MNLTAQPHGPRARRWKAALAGMLAGGIVLAACSSSEESEEPAATGSEIASGAAASGGDLLWAIETTLSTVNPHLNGQDKARPIFRNVFDSYLYLDEEGQLHPWLAEEIDLSDDGTVLTLTLRDDVTFSDGDALNADAVLTNFDKFLDGQYLSSSIAGLHFLEDIEAVDDYTVEFTLSQPDNYFLLWLSLPNSAPLSPSSFELPQETLEAGGPELAGTGPFVISDYTLNTELVLTKRDDYNWAPEAFANEEGAAYLDSVTYRTLSEGPARSGALEQGQVDAASDIQPLDVPTFAESEDFAYVRNGLSGTPYSLYLNVSKPPFDDIRVREAFARGADIDAIITSIYQGTYDRAWSPITPVGPFGDESLEGWIDFDIDGANRLLDEAGWTERNDEGVRVKDGEPLVARAVAGAQFVRESRDQLNIALGAALKQNVGIDFRYEPVDSGTEFERADANDYEVFDNSYGLADPVAGLDLLYYSSDPTRGFIARGRFNDSDLEQLIDTGRFNADRDARAEVYDQVQAHVTENFYVVPLTNTQDTYAYDSTRVNGITVDPASGQLFGAYNVWLSE